MEATLDLKADINDNDVASLFSAVDERPAVENPENLYPNKAESYHQQRYRFARASIKAMSGITIVSGVVNEKIALTLVDS